MEEKSMGRARYVCSVAPFLKKLSEIQDWTLSGKIETKVHKMGNTRSIAIKKFLDKHNKCKQKIGVPSIFKTTIDGLNITCTVKAEYIKFIQYLIDNHYELEFDFSSKGSVLDEQGDARCEFLHVLLTQFGIKYRNPFLRIGKLAVLNPNSEKFFSQS
jgi:hypothetical protein